MACFHLPRLLFAAPRLFVHRVSQVYLCHLNTKTVVLCSGSYSRLHTPVLDCPADISDKVCQGDAFPEGLFTLLLESPCQTSAKHHLLGACLPLMAPFRGMLLTLRDGPQSLASKAHRVPVYPRMFPSFLLAASRRTRMTFHLLDQRSLVLMRHSGL